MQLFFDLGHKSVHVEAQNGRLVAEPRNKNLRLIRVNECSMSFRQFLLLHPTVVPGCLLCYRSS